jgi:hypothetical protein
MKTWFLFLVGGCVGAVVWVLIMKWITGRIWVPPTDGQGEATRDAERFPLPTGDAARPVIDYHNAAIYKDFQYYYRTTGVILGAVAAMVLKGDGSPATQVLLVRAAGDILVIATLLCAFFIVAHQKSKIERWARRPNWKDMLTWQEAYMIIAMAAVGCAVRIGLVPELVAALEAGRLTMQ